MGASRPYRSRPYQMSATQLDIMDSLVTEAMTIDRLADDIGCRDVMRIKPALNALVTRKLVWTNEGIVSGQLKYCATDLGRRAYQHCIDNGRVPGVEPAVLANLKETA